MEEGVKMLVTTYKTTWCHDAEDNNSNINCCSLVVYLMILFHFHGFYSVELWDKYEL
jgi:hypothetical protein